MNYQTIRRGRIPLLVRRGGCGFNKKLRSHRKPAADGVVAHKPLLKNALRNMVCERPPRPLHERWLRAIFLMSRPPLLTRRGMRPTDISSIHSHVLTPWVNV